MRGLERRVIAPVFCATLLLGACSGKGKPADDPVLARVNGSAITASELNAAVERSFGADAELADTRRKGVLESLVLSRAIALAREKELDEAGKRAIERKVAAYREEVLVREYLAQARVGGSATSSSAARELKFRSRSAIRTWALARAINS